MTANQKCGKWCDCGKPAAWLIVEIGCQVSLCDKDARSHPAFGKKTEDFAWYEIPLEQRETEYRANVNGYIYSTDQLAKSVHQLRFDVLAEYYSEASEELRRQAAQCREEGSLELAQVLQDARKAARGMQTLFVEMHLLSSAGKEKVN